MTVTHGFWNSLAGDRTYDAEEMSRLFTGIIEDGIFSNIGTNLIAVADGVTMNLLVGEGRAWFNETWTDNDAALAVAIPTAGVVYGRIDAVVLEVDKNESARVNSFKVVSGIEASTPVKPTLESGPNIFQYPLCYVTVAQGVTVIDPVDVENTVGTAEAPYIIGALQTVSIDDTLAQWEAEFGVWFDEMKDQLSEDAAGNLQLQIDDINEILGTGFVQTNITLVAADGLAVIGEGHNVSITGMTVDLDYVIPAPTAVGEEIAVYLVDKSVAFSLSIKGDTGVTLDDGSTGSEWKATGEGRIFKKGEYVLFRSTSLTNWKTVVDGRIASKTVIYNSVSQTITSSLLTAVEYDTIRVDNADSANVSLNRIIVRRAGMYVGTNFVGMVLDDTEKLTAHLKRSTTYIMRMDIMVSAPSPDLIVAQAHQERVYAVGDYANGEIKQTGSTDDLSTAYPPYLSLIEIL